MLPGMMMPALAGLVGGGPSIITANTTTLDGETSPFTLNLPSGLAINDIVLMFLSKGGSGTQTFTWPSGFTQLYSDQVRTTATRTACAWKKLQAGAPEIGASTISVSSSYVGSANVNAVGYRIRDGVAAFASAGVNGNSNIADPPSLTPASRGGLWFATGHADSPASVWTYPSEYTLGHQSGAIFSAARSLNAATENPDTFFFFSTVEFRVYTLAISGE